MLQKKSPSFFYNEHISRCHACKNVYLINFISFAKKKLNTLKKIALPPGKMKKVGTDENYFITSTMYNLYITLHGICDYLGVFLV